MYVDATNSLKKSTKMVSSANQLVDLNVKIQDVLTTLHMDYFEPWPISL